MFHYVTLFTVAPHAEEAFARALRYGGDWLCQARRVAPDFVAADLLRHEGRPLYLCHDIWTTPEAFYRSMGSDAIRQLFEARKHMAVDFFAIGTFTFPTVRETGGTSKADEAKTAAGDPPAWFTNEHLEEELQKAIIQATSENRCEMDVALAQVDEYFAADDREESETAMRRSIFKLLRLFRPQLVELLGAPATKP